MEVISMMFKLTNAYSLCITISFELNDVPIYTINPKEVKCRGEYYPNVICILKVLMSAKIRGA